MHARFCAIIFVLALLFSVPARGEASSLPSVACVDFARALNEVSDGRRARERLKNEFREKQHELGELQGELKTARDSLDRDRLLLSPEAIEEREAKYRQKFSELQLKLDSFKREMSAKEAEFTQGILSKLRSIVKDLGKSDGYTLVLEKSQDVLLYAPEGSDITDKVIAIYDGGAKGKRK